MECGNLLHGALRQALSTTTPPGYSGIGRRFVPAPVGSVRPLPSPQPAKGSDEGEWDAESPPVKVRGGTNA